MSTLRSNAARLAAVCAIGLLSACSSDPNAASIAGPDVASAPLFDVTPTPNLVIIPIGDPGAFTNAVAPNNSGRLNTEFWDNLSSDGPPCNMGFFATGTIGTNCASERGNSDANAGGGYTRYFGDGAEDRDAAGFMFNGDYSYTVTLQGSYTDGAANTTAGYFTKNLNGTYNLFPVPSWTSPAGVGTPVTINTGGADWGFYINYTPSPDNTGCVSPTVHCSDATGGFTSAPFQHFALMLNPTTSTYLVGAEDNRLGLYTRDGDPANPTNEDSDYNDYMWSVVPNQVKVADRGCSPGYWKNHLFPAGYTKNQRFDSDIPGTDFADVFGSMTFQEVLEQGGGGLKALGRHTVSAYFNAVVFGADYGLTPQQVVSKFNAAVAAGGSAIEALSNEFAAMEDVNGRECNDPTGREGGNGKNK